MSHRSLRRRVALFTAVFIGAGALFTLLEWRHKQAILLPDGDTFARYARIQEMLDSGDWYAATLSRSNTPDGEILAWPHVLDVLLLAGAWPLHKLAGMEISRALLLWGTVLSPVTLVLSTTGLVWAARPLNMAPRALGLAVAVFLFHPDVTGAYAFGVADHHGLIALAFIYFLGLFLRLRKGSLTSSGQWLAGGLCGFAIWIAPEFVIPLGVVGLWTVWQWIKGDNGQLLVLSRIHAAAAAILILAMLVEHDAAGGNFWRAEADRVSSLHLVLIAGTALVLRLCHQLEPRLPGIARRGGAAAVIVATLLAGGSLLLPRFYLGPLVAVDPALYKTWYLYSYQFHPVYSAFAGLTMNLLFLAVVIPMFVLRTGQQDPPATDRPAWHAMLFVGLAFCLLSSVQLRWITYMGVVFALLYAHVVEQHLLLAKIHLGRAGTWVVIVLAVLIFPVAGYIPASTAAEAGMSKAIRDCNDQVTRMVQHDELSDLLSDRQSRVFAGINHGPAILFWTRHEIVAWSAHRNVSGLLDHYRIFTDQVSVATESDLEEIVRRRELDGILFCPAEFATEAHRNHVFNSELPDWLAIVSGDRTRLDRPVLLQVRSEELYARPRP